MFGGGHHAARIVPDSVFARSQGASGAEAEEAPELNKAFHAEEGRVPAAADKFGGVSEKLSNSCLVSGSMPDGTARDSICKIPVSVNERPVDVQARRNAAEWCLNISASGSKVSVNGGRTAGQVRYTRCTVGIFLQNPTRAAVSMRNQLRAGAAPLARGSRWRSCRSSRWRPRANRAIQPASPGTG